MVASNHSIMEFPFNGDGSHKTIGTFQWYQKFALQLKLLQKLQEVQRPKFEFLAMSGKNIQL